jgi:hypothetical protein
MNIKLLTSIILIIVSNAFGQDESGKWDYERAIEKKYHSPMEKEHG